MTNKRKKASKKFEIKIPKNCIGFATYKPQDIYLIFKHNYHPDEKFPSSWTIAHECLHATKHILNKVGIKASNKNDEAEAYLLTWIIEKTSKALNKFTKSKL